MCGSPRSLPRARSSSARGRQRNGQMSCWFSPAAALLGCQIHLGGFLRLLCGGEGVSLFCFFFFLLKQNKTYFQGKTWRILFASDKDQLCSVARFVL